jgi:hypothetical protein
LGLGAGVVADVSWFDEAVGADFLFLGVSDGAEKDDGAGFVEVSGVCLVAIADEGSVPCEWFTGGGGLVDDDGDVVSCVYGALDVYGGPVFAGTVGEVVVGGDGAGAGSCFGVVVELNIMECLPEPFGHHCFPCDVGEYVEADRYLRDAVPLDGFVDVVNGEGERGIGIHGP